MNSDETETVNRYPFSESDSQAAPLPSLIGTRIGSFTLRRIIGSGGMGTVYEAQQEQPRRRVAIKMMKHGITSSSALRRFEFESQTLARLHHPGIAQVYEAGTHDDGAGGVPYFVMEYIPNALKITEYADKKKLGTRERLALFAKVCDAIQHGHLKGIVHRDIKPGNVLVDSNGQPKIIDFGVARSTDSDLAVTTLQTDVGQLLGTLQYMSPEQCGSDPSDIDTRSDIYALGMVLYKLLTGRLPYDIRKAAIHEAVRIVREEEPLKLSSIDRHLRGDVETIALKALEKERERRYQSAAALEQDIDRYLMGDPISARRATIWYHLKRLAIRHKVAFALASSFVILLIASTVVSLSLMRNAMNWQAKAFEMRDQAIEDRQLAQQHALQAREAQSAAEKASEAALRQAYLGNIYAASKGLDQNDFKLVQGRLEAARLAHGDLPPEEMPFEWRYLKASCDQSSLIWTSNGELIRDIEFSPDCTQLIVRTRDASGSTLRVLDISEAQEVELPVSLRKEYRQLMKASRVVVDGLSRKMMVKDPFSDVPISKLEGGESCLPPFVFSEDGTRVAASSKNGNSIVVWDVGSGAEVSRYVDPEDVNSKDFALSSDGRRLAISGRASRGSNIFLIGLMDIHEGSPMPTKEDASGALRHLFLDSYPTSMAFSPDGGTLAVACLDGRVRLLDVDLVNESGTIDEQSVPFIELGDMGNAMRLRFDAKGEILVAVTRQNQIRAWDLGTGEILSTLRGQGASFRTMRISDDGEYLAIADRENVIRVWTLSPYTGISDIISDSDGMFRTIAVSPDSSTLVSNSKLGQIDVRSLQSGELVTTLRDDMVDFFLQFDFSPDGARLAALNINGDVQIWNMLTGKLENRFSIGDNAMVPSMAYSPDGKLLALDGGSPEVEIMVWDLESDSLKYTLSHGSIGDARIQFGPDSSILYSLDDSVGQAGIKAWDLDKGDQLRFEVHASHLKTFARTFDLSPDGESIAVGYQDGSFAVLDSSSLRPLFRKVGHDRPVASLVYSPDGDILATLGEAGNRETSIIRLWDSRTGVELLSLFDPEAGLRSIQFSPDGLMLIAMDGREGIYIWDTRSLGRQLADRTLLMETQRAMKPLVDSWFDRSDGDVDRVIEMFKLESAGRSPQEKVAIRNLLLKKLGDR